MCENSKDIRNETVGQITGVIIKINLKLSKPVFEISGRKENEE